MRKNIALILALVMIFSMIPMTASAQASASYSTLTGVPTVSEQTYTTGTETGVNIRVEISIPDFALNGGETLTVEVPRGVFVEDFDVLDADGSGANVTNDNISLGAWAQGVNALRRTALVNFPTAGGDWDVVLEFTNVIVMDNYVGADELQFGFSSSSQVFGDTDLTVARVTVGDVVASMLDVNYITDGDGDIGILRLTESQAGGFEDGDDVDIKLPRGFYWEENTVSITDRWNTGASAPTVSYRDLVNGKPQTVRFRSTGNTSERSSWEIDGLEIVIDPTMAQYGEVEASVSGASPSTMIVANYGDFLAEVTAMASPTRYSGKFGQRLGDIEIKELIGASMIEDRTITMTLPSGVKWDVRDDGEGMDIRRSDSSNYSRAAGSYDGIEWDIVDVAGRTLRARVPFTSTSQNPVTAVLESPRVAIAPTFEGDITVNFGGSAGVGGEVVLAEAVKPVSAEATEIADVRLGVSNQAVGDIVLTEVQAGAIARPDSTTTPFAREGIITLTPVWDGVRFATTPTATAEGDIMIEDIWTSPDGTRINIQVNADSDADASEITISNLELSLDRVMPEGALELQVAGDAIIDRIIHTSAGTQTAYFSGANVSTKFQVANVVTPADDAVVDAERAEVAFTVGSTTYTVNGETMMMDVAPYISNDRMMIPVRYLEDMFGMQPNWNEASRTVTVLFEGDVYGMAIGSNMITLNGADYMEMDATAEITGDRTFVPASRFARAMGVDYEWDAMTNTATFK